VTGATAGMAEDRGDHARAGARGRRRANGPLLLGAGLGALVALAALLAPVIAPHAPEAQNIMMRLTPPAWMPGGSASYPLGTDDLGRDEWSMLLYAGRWDLSVSLSAALLASAFGTLVGALGGYVRGPWSVALMRAVDMAQAFPFIVLALAMIVVMGPGFVPLTIALTVGGWVMFARVSYATALEVSRRAYVEAARSIGASPARVFLRHVLPEIVPAVEALVPLAIADAILFESGLTFLGLGAPPQVPSWGSMLADGREYIQLAWWMTVWPGLCIVVSVFAVNLLAEGLRRMRSGSPSRKEGYAP
jgi:peptide/nickel transport system permease protein